MRLTKRRSSAVAALTTVALVTAWPGALTGASASAPSTGKDDAGSRAPARMVREIETEALGLNRPTGLTWDAERRLFVVAGRAGTDGTAVTSLMSTEQRRGKKVVAGLEDPSNMAYDPRTNRVVALQGGRLVTVGAEQTKVQRWVRGRAANALEGVDPAGTTYSSDGTLHVLEPTTNTIVSVSPDGSVDRTAIQGLDEVKLEGLAYQPNQNRLYVSDTSAHTLYALGWSGEVVATRDLSDAEVVDLQAMTFAPSGDTTDSVAQQSLYLADAGAGDQLGSVTEVSLAAVAVTSEGYDEQPTFTATRQTWTWDPPSPDPSGITYLGNGELLVSDGEVEEIPLYSGANFYVASTDGSLVPGKTGTTVVGDPAWSTEPVGLEYRASDGHLFVSDDGKKVVFEIAGAGADGTFGTIDDGVRTSFSTSAFGAVDPEGVAYDSKRDQLLISDGVNKELYRTTTDGALLSHVDVGRFGIVDPEGITYDADRDTVVVVDDSAIWELDELGSLLGKIDLSGLSAADKLAGITIAPASSGAGEAYYIVDRGSDSDVGNIQNDGMIHEVRASLPGITNRPPTAYAGADQVIEFGETAQLVASGEDPEGATLAYSWAKSEGPGTVEFAMEESATSTATFSAAGTYVLRVTVSDGVDAASDDVKVTVYETDDLRTVSIPIATGSDDAREGNATPGSTSVNLIRAHNRLGGDYAVTNDLTSWYPLTIGLRFAGLPVPNGGQIVSAQIQFRTESVEVSTGPASLQIRGEASADAATFAATSGNVSKRPSTTATVQWAPPDWTVRGDDGPGQRTPELAAILQEIVDQDGWAEGHAAAFVITGTGTRSAESFEGGSPPVLELMYRTQELINQRPEVASVTAEPPTVKLPGSVKLTATVTDDNLPDSVEPTTTWSQVSGPGTATFSPVDAKVTTASFTKEGDYVLRVTADDGELTGHADVSITVQAADVVSTPTPSPTPTPGGGGSGGGGGAGTPDPTPAPTPTPTPTPDPVDTPDDLTVTLQSQQRSIAYGGTVRVSGVVADGGLASEDTAVRVFVRRAPAWRLQELGSTTTDDKGAFVAEDRPGVTSRYYAKAGGATSGVVEVLVRPRLSATVTGASVLAGTRTAVVGQVSPTVKDHVLRLQRWNGNGWRTIASTSLMRAAQARYRFAVLPKASGVTRYRVVSPAQGGRARTVSAGLVVKAYDAALQRVNARGDVVVVKNTGTVAVSLAGWWLVEARRGARVVLPEFVLRPGRVVRIHSRAGTSDRRNLFLDTGEMWGVRGVAELRDARLRLADRLRY